jgi:glycosyltransferase involved in cell wall biosynthesis
VTSSTPTVSVIIPTHNSSNTIVRALDSIAWQTTTVHEVVIVDDASTDDTLQVARDYAQHSPLSIVIHELHENLGPGFTRNTGWERASGELIAFLDADDAWHPRKIESQLAVMVAHPHVVMSCHTHRFDIDGEWAEVNDREPIHSHDLKDFLVKNRCATPTVMLRHNIPERFATAHHHAEDYLLWMRIVAHHGPCLKIDAPLTHCANPAFGGSGLSGDLRAMERAELAAFRTLRRDGLISTPRLVTISLWSLAKFAVRVIDRRLIPIRSRRR